VIYHNYPRPLLLDQELCRLKHEYDFHPNAAALFLEIYNERKKLCLTYTRSYFTNGFVATVISESKNSSMKSGNRKTKMKKYNMSDQCKMLMSWETKLDAQALDEIMTLVTKPEYSARPWSNFVDNAFDKAVLECQKKVVSVQGALRSLSTKVLHHLFQTVTG
jgi:hypothetical protein